MVYPQNKYFKTLDLSPVNEFKGRSTDMIEMKVVVNVVHLKIQLSPGVSNDDSFNSRDVICVEFPHIWSSFFLWKCWLLLKNE